MSILDKDTEKRAIYELAQCLRHFDHLAECRMSGEDAREARQAENLIRCIIETNGYRAVRERKRIEIRKLQNKKQD